MTPNNGPTGVKGVIRNNKGYRIPYSRLDIIKNGQKIATTKADSNGVYHIKDIEAGIYEFEYSAASFKTTILINAEIIKGHIWDLDITLNKKRKRDKATHVSMSAPKNYGNQLIMGSISVIGQVTIERYDPWRLPGHPADLINSMFHLD